MSDNGQVFCPSFFLFSSLVVVVPSAAPLPDARPTGIWDRPKKAPGLISFLLFILLLLCLLFFLPGFFFCCCSSLCCKAHPSGIWSRPKKHQDYSQFLTETVMRPFLALPNSSLSFLPFCHFNFLAVSVENRNQMICHQKVFSHKII